MAGFGKALEKLSSLVARKFMEILSDDEFMHDLKHMQEMRFSIWHTIEEEFMELSFMKDLHGVVRYYPNETYPSVYAAYSFTPGDRLATGRIDLHLDLPEHYDYNFINAEIKGAIRHELEHAMQDEKILVDLAAKVTAQDGYVWHDLDNAREYYTSEAETKAHVVGLYKRAKMQKKPFINELEEFLNDQFHTALMFDHSEEEASKLLNRVSELWLYYADYRYPNSLTRPEDYVEA